MSAVRSAQESQASLARGVVEEAASRAPEWLKPVLLALAPVAGMAAKGVNLAGPYVAKAYNHAIVLYRRAEPYHPNLVLPMIIGLVMMLFGGYLMTLIAVIEAYRICGWEQTQLHLHALYDDYLKVKEESDKDDKEDADGDGVADVLQISEKELVTRKIKLFFKACNPLVLTSALSGIYSGFVAVLATLQMQFARTLSLGVAIGEVLSQKGYKFLYPLGLKIVPDGYHKWIPVVINYFFKLVGVTIAMFLQRILAAFHSAVRGAQIFTQAFAVYTAQLGYHKLSEGYWDEAFAVLCAMFGLYLQISTGFEMPWFLSVFLFPFLFVERILGLFVAYKAL